MSSGFSWFVIIGTVLSLISFFLILFLNKSVSNPGDTTGHKYDGIEEYDNPLPAWWYWGFMFSILFGVVYLIYYPGLGNFPGVGGWTQIGELEQAQEIADQRYGPIFAQYRDVPIEELVETDAAMKMGRRIFATNCSVCHGTTGRGAFGFPNLTDDEWQWGHGADQLITTISGGRTAGMAPYKDILGQGGVKEVTEYVLHLAKRKDLDKALVDKGRTHFQTYCFACHGQDGKGQAVFGAPDLTNDIWLYGNSRDRISHVISNGRQGQMPAFQDKLGSDKVRILAAYVKSLSK